MLKETRRFLYDIEHQLGVLHLEIWRVCCSLLSTQCIMEHLPLLYTVSIGIPTTAVTSTHHSPRRSIRLHVSLARGLCSDYNEHTSKAILRPPLPKWCPMYEFVRELEIALLLSIKPLTASSLDNTIMTLVPKMRE